MPGFCFLRLYSCLLFVCSFLLLLDACVPGFVLLLFVFFVLLIVLIFCLFVVAFLDRLCVRVLYLFFVCVLCVCVGCVCEIHARVQPQTFHNANVLDVTNMCVCVCVPCVQQACVAH